MAPTKIIIDTDAGTDDALAIFMALEAQRQGWLEILAITTVQGNTSVNNVNNNVLRILHIANMLQKIPVYSGAKQSLVHPWSFDNVIVFHGADGFGDAELPPLPPAVQFLQPRHAALALVELVKQHAGQVTLVALGPLTNLALAHRLDPVFTSQLAALYVMGGNTTGEGNITVAGEFNFRCDVDAAFVVLEETAVPIHLTPWETCKSQASFSFEKRKEFGQIKSSVSDLMNKIEAYQMRMRYDGAWVNCDQLVMAWVIDDAKHKWLKTNSINGGPKCDGFLQQEGKRLVTETKTCFASVETSGALTKGQMVIDHMNLLSRKHNVILMEKIDLKTYVKYIEMAFGANF